MVVDEKLTPLHQLHRGPKGRQRPCQPVAHLAYETAVVLAEQVVQQVLLQTPVSSIEKGRHQAHCGPSNQLVV